MRRRTFLLGGAVLATSGCAPSALARVLASDKVRARAPGSAMAIAAYERTYGVSFSEGYRRFLLAANGMDTFFDFDVVKRVGVNTALWDIDTIFGIENGDDGGDLALQTPGWRFYDRRFLAFAPAIGLGGDFCTFSEVTKGRHSGTIMYTDGEMFGGVQRSFDAGRAVDEIIADWLKIGYFAPVAPSFDALIDMYAKIVEAEPA